MTSSPPLRDAETNALQGFHDQVVLAKPITKFAHRITTCLEIPRIVSLAWRTASTGAPGPVLLDFPIDVLFTPVEAERVSWGNIMAPPVRPPGPDPTAIQELVDLLKGAERPTIIVGTGARGVRCTRNFYGSLLTRTRPPKRSQPSPAPSAFQSSTLPNLALLSRQLTLSMLGQQ